MNLFHDVNFMFLAIVRFILMCCIYCFNIFALLVLLIFLTNLSELQINAEDVSRFLETKRH